MKKMGRMSFLLVILCGILFSVASANAASPADVPRIDVDTLKGLLDGPEAAPAVLDVRTGASWDDSEHMILSAIREDPGKVAGWAEKYAKEDTIVLYCT